jgi:hypothetical protein
MPHYQAIVIGCGGLGRATLYGHHRARVRKVFHT